jgi:trehalose 6-phosphate phosphatase
VRDLLADRHSDVLARFAWSNVLLAFDYDGTLAPIVADPSRAVMRATTRDLLDRVCEHYPVIVISGRAQADVRALLGDVAVRDVVGNHGIEPWTGTPRLAEEVQRWVPRLAERLAGWKGVHIEDKVYSLAIHYRQSREKRRARAAIQDATRELGDVRIIGGKLVVNVLPRDAPHKGIALEREREGWGCDTAIYVGDDDTDEDVFALDQPGRLLSVRVGMKRTSAAHYFVRDQKAIDRLLRALLEQRSASDSTRRSTR